MGFEPNSRPSRKEAVTEFVDRMKSVLEEARSTLIKAKDDMAKYYNQRRTPTPTYKPGDKDFLNTSNIETTRPSQQLSHQYLRPYPIDRRVSRHAYRLQLPKAMGRIHPVFHVIKLLPAPKDPVEGQRVPMLPHPEIVDGEPEYELEAVLDSQIHQRKLQYLVAWKGYGYEEHSWVDEDDIHAP
jgi:hypothetical protein